MNTRYFALILGIMFLLIGVMGFIPGLVTHDMPTGTTDVGSHADHGRLLGLFPVNTMHNLVHLAFGAWGVIAYRRWDASRTYARATAIIYGLLAIMGLIPNFNTMFGMVPLHGHDVWLHAAIAAAAAYFGFATSRDPAHASHGAVTDTGATHH
ncbi:MAG TPA: DUF4383 domain-containing protein [Tepidisphaeraceae bacterium]|nr:DUF4383 domain-containing protein [Tepidisphaeraceae bacterium]